MSRTKNKRSKKKSKNRWFATGPPQERYLSVACILIGIFLLLSGCELLSSEDDEIDLAPGTFKVQVEGYVNQSFEGGEAVFETEGTGLGYYFALVLRYTDADSTFHRIKFRHKIGIPDDTSSLQPNIGTYELANLQLPKDQRDSTKYSGSYEKNAVDEYHNFHSKGGTLTLTESNEELIKGSFEFQAFGHEQEIQVTGEFHAEPGEAVGDVF